MCDPTLAYCATLLAREWRPHPGCVSWVVEHVPHASPCGSDDAGCCGLHVQDSKPWRLRLGVPVTWWDVDQPGVMHLKQQLLAAAGAASVQQGHQSSAHPQTAASTDGTPPDQQSAGEAGPAAAAVQFPLLVDCWRPVAADLSQTRLRSCLQSSGFDPYVPTVWLAEALLYYLPLDQVIGGLWLRTCHLLLGAGACIAVAAGQRCGPQPTALGVCIAAQLPSPSHHWARYRQTERVVSAAAGAGAAVRDECAVGTCTWQQAGGDLHQQVGRAFAHPGRAGWRAKRTAVAVAPVAAPRPVQTAR